MVLLSSGYSPWLYFKGVINWKYSHTIFHMKMSKWMIHANTCHFYFEEKQNLGIKKKTESQVDPIWRLRPTFLVSPLMKNSGHSHGAAPILETCAPPLRQVNPKSLSSPSSCLASNTLKKTKNSNIPSTVQLEPPSPKGMLFLARDLPKETTSVEPPALRSGESWGS